MALDQTIALTFTVDGGPDDQFRVYHFRGEEGISQIYRFDIDVVAREPDIDLADLVHRRATLIITDRTATRHVPGMVQDVTQHGETHTHQFLYRFTLVPRAAKLTLSRQNQIYGTLEDVSALDVARVELTGEGVRGPSVEAASYLAAHDVDLSRVWDADAYPKRDYIVQYEESDWAFISRLLEHWGIFYYFAHAPEGEQLVLGNGNHAFANIHHGDRDGGGGGAGDSNETDAGAEGSGDGDAPEIPYRPTSGLGAAAEHAIHRFGVRTKGLPKKLILKDYNWRNPSIPLQAETEVDPQGHGVVSLYGEHFRTPSEGDMLAKIRAEELRAEKTVFDGASDCPSLAAGHLFRLAEHFRGDYNGSYVVVSVVHEGRQPLGDVVLDGETTGPDYTNAFVAYPDDVPYRPPRRTPKPKVAGLFTAHVDAAGPGTRAEIDGDGCYKVRVPFDLAGSPHGKASRYVRRSQPYGGRVDQNGGSEPVSGFHFPLLKGTEVVCACVNGDPDRPVIMGAMPNRLGPSVVQNETQTRNRVKTASGIVMQFEDSTP